MAINHAHTCLLTYPIWLGGRGEQEIVHRIDVGHLHCSPGGGEGKGREGKGREGKGREGKVAI